jgi:hypothetical protein
MLAKAWIVRKTIARNRGSVYTYAGMTANVGFVALKTSLGMRLF